MNSLRKLNSFIRAKKYKRKIRNCVYIYTPLPNNKFGYIIEYRRPEFSEVFYYKYKKNADDTLTKYGYLISDPGIGFGHNNSNRTKNQENKGGLWANKDKDCIFYQTVADKTQIELENRWMNEIRKKGRLEIYQNDDENNRNEWVDVMQHNNKIYICDNIQRRRIAEVLEKYNNNCINDNLSTSQDFVKDQPHLETVGNIEDRRRLRNDPPPRPTCMTTPSDNEPSSDATSEFSPPITPTTPPSSPSEAYSAVKPNGLLNMNIRQRHQRTSSKDSTKNISLKNSQPINVIKPQKVVHLSHPKFSRRPPLVHIFDPDDSLIFKNCKCEHCIIGQYNE
ncbi:1275_t:CDS:1 [Dentiscutata heterogama]|uniref:1275_t:CDS:1 n=1 Tax=Dentiscutata heterogama TaxID=1316150 RepID=A0ACA9KBH4_9GLOM|nr:1275_t:CDS:1 [Dentiscutata heterogama]